ncbi:MAG: hypothetical protein DHS20C11_03360 [Lysobacteraceae bacterium]|nr:MAG: hypothetical protein DHS20C11_03360 [Xanthomonadaceae bacterium]
MTFKGMGIVVALLASWGVNAATEQVRELNGTLYEKQRGQWIQVESSGDRYAVDSRVITVKFKQTAARSSQSQLHTAMRGFPIREAITGFIDVELAPDDDPLAAVERYLASGLVEVAEPNTFGVYHALPDDPDYGTQWYLPQVRAEVPWDFATGDPSVVVAVLDSGTEFTHEDLGLGADAYQNVWLNPGEDAWSDPDDPTTGNGIDDDGNGYVDDWKGYDFDSDNNDGSGSFFHGTAVAGVVSAKSNNGIGIASVAGGWNGPGAKVMIGGVGESGPNGSVLDDAILYAAENGANIVQMSLGVGTSAAIDAALQMAYDTYGVLIVCSSGNNGDDQVGYPSSDEHVISVGATSQSDARASFSEHGPGVELSGPGTSIFTLDLFNSYGSTSGTSFSAPLVSSVAALLWSYEPSLTNVELRQLLRDTAARTGGYDYNWNKAMPGHSYELGYGRVDAYRALFALLPDVLQDNGFEIPGN